MLVLAGIAGILFFGGGTEPVLAEAIQKEFKRPVAILMDPDSRWKGGKIEYRSRENLPNFIGGRLGLATGDPEVFGLAKKHFPFGFFNKQNDHMYSGGFKSGEKQAVLKEADGLLTIDCSGEITLQLSRLRVLPAFSKLKWHWFFDSAHLAISCNLAKPKDVLLPIAGALGATVSETNSDAYLDINYRQLRKRAVSLMSKLAQDPQTNAVVRLDASYYGELYSTVSEKQLRAAYSKYGAIVEVPLLPGTRLRSLALERLALAARFPGNKEDSLSRNLINLVDPKGQVMGRLSSDGHIAVKYQGRDRLQAYVY